MTIRLSTLLIALTVFGALIGAGYWWRLPADLHGREFARGEDSVYRVDLELKDLPMTVRARRIGELAGPLADKIVDCFQTASAVSCGRACVALGAPTSRRYTFDLRLGEESLALGLLPPSLPTQEPKLEKCLESLVGPTRDPGSGQLLVELTTKERPELRPRKPAKCQPKLPRSFQASPTCSGRSACVYASCLPRVAAQYSFDARTSTPELPLVATGLQLASSDCPNEACASLTAGSGSLELDPKPGFYAVKAAGLAMWVQLTPRAGPVISWTSALQNGFELRLAGATSTSTPPSSATSTGMDAPKASQELELSASGTRVRVPAGDLLDGKWHHVAMSFGEAFELWIDGNSQAREVATWQFPARAMLRIDGGSVSRVDELILFDRALDDATVRHLHRFGGLKDPPEPVVRPEPKARAPARRRLVPKPSPNEMPPRHFPNIRVFEIVSAQEWKRLVDAAPKATNGVKPNWLTGTTWLEDGRVYAVGSRSAPRPDLAATLADAVARSNLGFAVQALLSPEPPNAPRQATRTAQLTGGEIVARYLDPETNTGYALGRWAIDGPPYFKSKDGWVGLELSIEDLTAKGSTDDFAVTPTLKRVAVDFVGCLVVGDQVRSGTMRLHWDSLGAASVLKSTFDMESPESCLVEVLENDHLPSSSEGFVEFDLSSRAVPMF